ncbi:MAG: bifunctional homocysteine S-methyltransferase/methylenetetrahydrofolate reductase, partial [Candidatus Krumholzibacteria bacterium]|nr:bifunctional homocysteine S-methyltransferase/methylenetetrahydrofolate reductase [Candidatus Krumholzibacteria bacterium]
YVAAGAEVIETNTFGANRFKLSLHGLDDRLADINRRGGEIARRAAGDAVLVAGSMGPLGIRIEPWGPTSNEDAEAAFREQAEALLQGGVDMFVLETFADLNELHQAINGVRSVSDLPVVAMMTLQQDGLGLFGTDPGEFAQRLSLWPVEAIGVNCSVGPKVMLEAVEKIARVVDKWIAAQPNAGIPQNVDGRNIYLTSPEYMAEYARRFVGAGARIVGGCCGTTPAHIRAIRDALRTLRPRRIARAPEAVPDLSGPGEIAAVPLGEKSDLGRGLAEGRFVTFVELVPPRGTDAGSVLAAAAGLKEAGIDAVNIPDSPRASSRMSPLALAVLIEREIGLETVLHYCCRDRNILGMQSDILGAQALGLRNILVITGDPIKTGDYPDATAVFDIDSIGLTNVIRRLNHGLDLGGRRLDPPTAFVVGVGVNPSAVDFEEEMKRFFWKVDAGAEYAVTQPVFDVSVFERFIEHLDAHSLHIPVIAGVWPLTSLKNAEFLNNEIPGVSVPDRIMERMRRACGGEAAASEGVAIAREIIDRIRPHVQGVQVSAPFNRHRLALEVLGLASGPGARS